MSLTYVYTEEFLCYRAWAAWPVLLHQNSGPARKLPRVEGSNTNMLTGKWTAIRYYSLYPTQ